MARDFTTASFNFSGEIVPPPCASRFGAVLLLCLIAAFGLIHTHALPHLPPMFWFDVVVLTLPLALASRSIYTVHFNLLLICYYLVNFLPSFPLYPFSQLGMVLVYGYVVLLMRPLRTSVGWLRLGHFNGLVLALIVGTIFISCAALMAWVQMFSPDLSRYKGTLPQLSPGLMVLYGIGFCTFNAALEEFTWRGVMMEALDSALGPGVWAIIIQAISFAAAHYRSGFPNGIVGSCMVFVYGIMLGVIRRKSRGIVGCWLAHVAADFTIYCLILYFMQKSAG